MTSEYCPAGGEHAWTSDVGPQHEHLKPAERIHCDECGASPTPEQLRDLFDAILRDIDVV